MGKALRCVFRSDRGSWESHRSYDYLFDGEAKVGDYAVVLTENRLDGKDEFKVVKVIAVVMESAKANKWVYAVFNEESALANMQKAEQRTSLMNAVRARIEEASFYKKALAFAEEEGDQGLKDMLVELKKLEG